jgi:hypothetical protein
MVEPTKRQLIWVSCLLLASVTFAVFFPALECDFVDYDDGAYVTENDPVQRGVTPDPVRWAFTTGHAGNWHPLTWLSHLLDVELFGVKAGLHHFTSVLLHCANSVLLLFVLNALTGSWWRSAFVAFLFALHPLRVESVAWVAERKDVLSGLFFMLTLLTYARYAKHSVIAGEEMLSNAAETVRSDASLEASSSPTHTQSRSAKRWLWYVATLICLSLGLMSKPMLVTLPFLLLLIDFWPLGRLHYRLPLGKAEWAIILEKIPFFALAVGSSWITFIMQAQGGAVSSLEAFPLELRVSNAVVSYARYLGKLLWPAGLAVFYPMPEAWPFWAVAGAGLVIVGLTYAVFRVAGRLPFLVASWLWFVGTLVPTIGLVQVGQQSMADRYTYLPAIGLFIAAVWGAGEFVRRWPRARVALLVGGFAAVAGCAALTARQVQVWRNNEALFAHALAVTRNNAVAHNNLGASLMDRGEIQAAHTHFAEAVRIKANYPDAIVNLAIAN